MGLDIDSVYQSLEIPARNLSPGESKEFTLGISRKYSLDRNQNAHYFTIVGPKEQSQVKI